MVRVYEIGITHDSIGLNDLTIIKCDTSDLSTFCVDLGNGRVVQERSAVFVASNGFEFLNDYVETAFRVPNTFSKFSVLQETVNSRSIIWRHTINIYS